MKTVFSNSSDCIHKFAQRTQSHGRSSNVFFGHNKIYSFGYHYELARFIDNNNIIIDNRGYSHTTSKHISKVTQATRQYRQWFTMNTDPKHVEYQLEELRSMLLRAKKPENYLLPALDLISKYNEYGQKFGFSYQSDALLKLIEFFQSDFSDLKDKIQENIKADKIKKQELLSEYKNAFYNFEPFEELRNRLDLNYDLIRLNGENIETSQNVRVPFIEAQKMFKRLMNGENINGEYISGYKVIKADKDLIKIGCHNIKTSEIEHLF